MFAPLFSAFPAYVYERHVCACCPGRSEEMLDPLELELQMAVNYHFDAENWTRVLLWTAEWSL